MKTKEELREYEMKYYRKNREKICKQKRELYTKHREKVLKSKRERWAERKQQKKDKIQHRERKKPRRHPKGEYIGRCKNCDSLFKSTHRNANFCAKCDNSICQGKKENLKWE